MYIIHLSPAKAQRHRKKSIDQMYLGDDNDCNTNIPNPLSITRGEHHIPLKKLLKALGVKNTMAVYECVYHPD